MSIKQISVFLENKPGTLKKLTSVMAKNKIDMRATSLAETKDFGIARLVVDDAMSFSLRFQAYFQEIQKSALYS